MKGGPLEELEDFIGFGPEDAANVQALARADNNQTKAAKLLGLTRDALRYRLQKLGLLP